MFAGIDPAHTVLIHTAGHREHCAARFPAAVRGQQGRARHVAMLCLAHGVRMVYVVPVHAIAEQHGGAYCARSRTFPLTTSSAGTPKPRRRPRSLSWMPSAVGWTPWSCILLAFWGRTIRRGRQPPDADAEDYLRGRLPACVRGGYDFVDVRDVAQGCLLAAQKGARANAISSPTATTPSAACWPWRAKRGRAAVAVLPLWMARAVAPLFSLGEDVQKAPAVHRLFPDTWHARPLHDKATSELGLSPADLRDTIDDTVAWLQTRALKAHRTRPSPLSIL